MQYAQTHGMTNAALADEMVATGATQETIAAVQRITSQPPADMVSAAADAVRASRMRRRARAAAPSLDDDTWEILVKLAEEEGISAVMAYLGQPDDTFLLDLHHHRHYW